MAYPLTAREEGIRGKHPWRMFGTYPRRGDKTVKLQLRTFAFWGPTTGPEIRELIIVKKPPEK